MASVCGVPAHLGVMPLWRLVCIVQPRLKVRPLWRSGALSHRTSPTEISFLGSELRDKSSSPRASVISIPELFTYVLYFVIAFVLDVIYLAIT